METDKYRDMLLLAFVVSILQQIAEASQVHLILEKNYITLLTIVGVKFGVSIFSVFKMLEQYGEGMDMIYVISLAEGSGFIGHMFIFVIEFYDITKKSSTEKKMRKA